MTQPRDFRAFAATLVAAALGLAALACTGGCFGPPPQTSAPPNPPSPREPGFAEGAAAAGITFRMSFLPKEQGENFKINLYDHGCGVAVGDVNGDGHEDLYLLNQLGRNALYQNKGDGTFTDVTGSAGVGFGDRICVGAVMDDYDNDGDQDLYVTSTRGGNVLLQNDGGGKFRDVTARAGLKHVGHSQSPVFFDPDRDGDLDLFVTNTARWTTNEYDRTAHYYVGEADFWDLAASPKEFNLFYLNNGDGTFTDATGSAGLKGQGWGGDVAVFDYDADGWPDLFVTNMFGRSQLYRNGGKGRFQDVTAAVLPKTSWGAIGAKAFDYDNDGRLDLFIADMHSDMWMGPDATLAEIEETKKYAHVTGRRYDLDPRGPEVEKEASARMRVRHEQVLFGNSLFHNEGAGNFREVSDQAGMETFWPWGVASGDFDNDGFVDAFLPSGMGYPFFYWRSYLMMNGGSGTFSDRSKEEGIDPAPGGVYLPENIGGKPSPRSSRCAVSCDFDGDGRLDLIVNNFNDHPYYLRNRFSQKSYLKLALTGTKSNRDAVGAEVRLFAGSARMIRQVDAAGGYLSRPSKIVHFGLGDRTSVDRVEIRWPSGATQTLSQPAINTMHRVTEPKS